MKVRCRTDPKPPKSNLRVALIGSVLISAIIGCGEAPAIATEQNQIKTTIQIKRPQIQKRRIGPESKRIPNLFECTSRDLNWRNRLHARLIKGIVDDSMLPVPLNYCRGNADQILRGNIREIKNILSENLNLDKTNRGDVIIIAIRVDSDGHLSFLFSNYLKRSQIGYFPDGRKAFNYSKADVQFPVNQINAALNQLPSRILPPKPSMTTLRFKVGKSGDIFRDGQTERI